MVRMKLVSDSSGELTEVPFTAEENAEADSREAAWVADTARREALARIADLEATITPRRLRDAVLTEDGAMWLEEVEAQIKEERGHL